jgi:integral membrane protein
MQAVKTPSPALTRYRVTAYVVGVGLLLLVLVAMPLKYLGGNPVPVQIIGPLHGFLYVVYLMTGFDLAVKNKWSVRGTLLVLVAGTIPFLSFVAERQVSRRVLAGTTL